MSNSAKTSNKSRIIALVLCVVVALIAALATRHFAQGRISHSAAAAGESAAPNPEKILALVPESKSDSPTDHAIAKARLLAGHSPKNASAWINLADAVMQKARDTADENLYDPAEMAYTRANLLDPRRVDALAGLAWVNGDRHLFDESIVWAKKALAIDPNNAAAYGIMGDAELELGDYDDAFRDYQKMADLHPDLSSYSRGAHLLWMTGNRPKALALMEKALRAGAPFAENTAWCRAQLALMQFQDGAYLSAEQTVDPALAAAPRNVRVLLVAARIKIALSDNSAAQELYCRVQEVAPNIEACAGLGDLTATAGQHEEAKKYYRQAEELHAVHVARKGHDHMQMARFDADHDRNLVDALRMAEQRKLTRNVLEADTLAWVYFKNGELEKAQQAIGRALSHDTPDPEIRFHAGMIAAKLGDRAAASKYLYTAVSWSPRFNLLEAPIAFQTLHDLGDERSVAAAQQ